MVAASLNIGPDAFVAKVRNIVGLKKSPNVPQIDKFSNPPAIEDLRSLTLDASDIDAITRCRPARSRDESIREPDAPQPISSSATRGC